MKLIFDALILTLCAVWLIDDAISPADTFDSISVSVCVIRELRVLSAPFARETSDVIEFSATVILDIAVSAVLFAVSAVFFQECVHQRLFGDVYRLQKRCQFFGFGFVFHA